MKVDSDAVDAAIYANSGYKQLGSFSLTPVSYGSDENNLNGIADGVNKAGSFTPGTAVGAYTVAPLTMRDSSGPVEPAPPFRPNPTGP
jgi:hypothetical protein